MTKKRLQVSLKQETALEVTRVSIGTSKLVYVLLANRKLKYPWGRSRIVNIGTTKKGLSRIASSAASRAEAILANHGVQKCSARVITCQRRQGVKTWRKLERALLLAFRELYGAVPEHNAQGNKIAEKDEFEYFAKSRLKQILKELAE